MKKIFSIIIAAAMAVTMFTVPSSAEKDKQMIKIDETYSIAVRDNKNIYQLSAAQELQRYIEEVIGARLPIVSDEAEKSIVICQTGNKSIYANGYRIFANGQKVYIDGTETRGYIHGVYRFLEEFAGLKIYTSKLKLIDRCESIAVPTDVSVLYNPYFEYTDTDFVSPRDVSYSLCNGLSGGVYRSIPEELGGTVKYIGYFAHTLTTQFCSADKYFETNPEYFAYSKGKRTPDQLCLTNPDVVELVTNEVLDSLNKHHKPKASLQIVSLTQNDNRSYCECKNCKSFEKAHGDVRSATVINFVNQIADAVKEAGYSNVAIDTFAYQYSRQAPENLVPRDNVIVRLCTIEGCFIHPLDDEKCSENAAIMKDLEAWSKICDRIYIWDYTNNYRNTLSVWPDFDVIQRNIQIFSEHNVKGIYEEGNFYMNVSDTEFGELKSYMISRCLQNPYCDLEKDVDGFLEAYYGDGWRNIKRFISLATEKGGKRNGHMSIYEDAEDCLRFNAKDIKNADIYWANALKLAKEDWQKENVERSMLSYRYYKACAYKGEFMLLNPSRFDNNEQLYNDIIASGVSCDQEGRYDRILGEKNPRYVKPNKWGRISDKSFFGKLIKFHVSFIEFIKNIFGK